MGQLVVNHDFAADEPLLGAFDRRLVGGPGRSENGRPRLDVAPLLGEEFEHVGHPAAAPADKVFLGNGAVVEVNGAVPHQALAHLVLGFADGKSRRIAGDEKCAEPLVEVLVRIGHGKHEIELR